VPNQKQRREAARRHLERQLEARQARDARRKQITLISSIAGTLVLILAIVIVVVATTGSSKKKPKASASQPSSSSSASTPAATPCGQQTFPTATVHAAKGTSVSFQGVTVKGAADLTGKPIVTSKSTKDATKLAVKDLVVGKGAAAGLTTASCVTVQYDGVFYKNGKEFDSSWKRGMLAQFSLKGVIAGFSQGIGGTTGITPMQVGGRRIIVVPWSLAYGANTANGIPGKSDLVFVVDLVKLSNAAPPATG